MWLTTAHQPAPMTPIRAFSAHVALSMASFGRFVNIADVGLHRRGGGLGIAGGERGNDGDMVVAGLAEHAGQVGGDAAVLGAEHIERVRDADEEGVAGRLDDGAVELEVGDPEADRIGQQLLLHRDDRGEARRGPRR